MNENSHITEKVILAQNGDMEAYGFLYEKFRSVIYAKILTSLRNESEALDLLHDVWLKVYLKLNQLKNPSRFAGWLHRITYHMIVNKICRKRCVETFDIDFIDEIVVSIDDPLEIMVERENFNNLKKAFNHLRPLDKDTLVSFYYDNKSIKEMSTEENAPIGTIKRRLHTARNRLRQEIDRIHY